MPTKKSFTKELTSLFYINLTVLVLILSAFNLTIKHKKTIQVLGAEVDNTFLEEIALKHPTYRDGWVELNRMDMVRRIDPNFSLEP